MPRLVYNDSQGRPQSYALKKKLTTLGRQPGNDLVLTDPSVSPSHAHILSEPSGYVIASMDPKSPLLVNGKARRSHPLRPDDTVTLGQVTLTFRMDDAPVAPPARRRRAPDAASVLPSLLKFSDAVGSAGSIEELFRTLLDQVIEITGADKGLLVLVQEGRLLIPVARNMDRGDLNRNAELLSDSIMNQVLEKGEPLIVTDASHDPRFGTAQSVVDLKITSVMCVPLKFRSKLLGALYLGNDKITGLFGQEDLDNLLLYAGQAALMLHNGQLVHELLATNLQLREELRAASFGRLIGQCEGMRRVMKTVDKVANTDLTVMIRGETGTGKELIARELHARSARKDKPFISINCGAIPEHLLESELFGHVKGSFTGAISNRMGKFEAAHGGTLFLDEIGEMPHPLQVKLLRVLQERLIDKVGENLPIPVDIRVISATHRDLETAITEGKFREDLFYRLNEIQIRVPALRERDDDILLLARYLLDRVLERYPNRKVKGFSKEALASMKSYYWPGNVRQLENKIKKAVILCEEAMVTPEDLELSPAPPKVLVRPLADAQAEFTLNYIRQVLELNNGNKTKTARDLDVDPRTIFRYMEKLDDQAET